MPFVRLLTERRQFTPLQGQYLAFIRAYTLIHREPPAEADMQRFFRVTPPAVHSMVLTLAERGLVERVPGRARSVRVVVALEDLPPLEEPSKRDEPQNNRMQRTAPAQAMRRRR